MLLIVLVMWACDLRRSCLRSGAWRVLRWQAWKLDRDDRLLFVYCSHLSAESNKFHFLIPSTLSYPSLELFRYCEGKVTWLLRRVIVDLNFPWITHNPVGNVLLTTGLYWFPTSKLVPLSDGWCFSQEMKPLGLHPSFHLNKKFPSTFGLLKFSFRSECRRGMLLQKGEHDFWSIPFIRRKIVDVRKLDEMR